MGEKINVVTVLNQYFQEMDMEHMSQPVRPNNTLAICALVFSVLCSLVGLVLGIIGMNKYPKNTSGRTMSVIAIIISVLMMVGAFILRGRW